MRKLPALLVIVLVSTSAWAGPTYIPVMNGQFQTGQWYFEGERSSLGGNAALAIIPAVRFSEKLSIIPTFETNYRGTRSAEELAGGTNLFQDTWENSVGVKAVHGLNERWNVRERVGYHHKFFRETTDESFSDGLYDYGITTVGAEVERHWKKRANVALAYDYSMLEFPNYSSLESSQTPDLAREFAGEHVLDQQIHMAALRGGFPLPGKWEGGAQAIYSPRFYDEQHVVSLSGLLTSAERKDTLTGGSLSLERMFSTPANTKLVTSFTYGYTKFDSNQNHYDAQETRFIGDFYDYNQQTAGTQLTLGFGRLAYGPMTFDAGYSYSRRSYTDRVIQNSQGNYLSDKLYINETVISLGFGYPLAKNFRLRTTATFGGSKSNNEYETLYRYNYSNASYLFGVTFDY